jgi:hypothetical protein
MGIRKIGAYSYLFEENGGFDNVGFAKQYFYNFVKKQKLIKVEASVVRTTTKRRVLWKT